MPVVPSAWTFRELLHHRSLSSLIILSSIEA